jgi:hypothetical protein
MMDLEPIETVELVGLTAEDRAALKEAGDALLALSGSGLAAERRRTRSDAASISRGALGRSKEPSRYQRRCGHLLARERGSDHLYRPHRSRSSAGRRLRGSGFGGELPPEHLALVRERLHA